MYKITIATLFTALLLAPVVLLAAGKTPSEAFLEYHAALKRGFSEKAILPYYTSAARKEFEDQFPPQMRGKAFFLMKAAAPAKVRVQQQKVDGNRAVLRVVATDDEQSGGSAADKAGATGEAILLLDDDGSWKIEKVVWQGQ